MKVTQNAQLVMNRPGTKVSEGGFGLLNCRLAGQDAQ